MKYKNIFFDLDDTLWATLKNSRETFHQVYEEFHYEQFFSSFDSFFNIYMTRNLQLWEAYDDNKITKEDLNKERFYYPLEVAGFYDRNLADRFSKRFFEIIPTKTGVMPYAKDLLEYLYPHYNLYILSNGFRGLQETKMKAAGLFEYFKDIILSDDIKVNKPHAELYQYAFTRTGSKPEDSIMVGDSWKNDVIGASNVGLSQIFYNVDNRTDFPIQPTYVVESLKEIENIL